jgi:hypothetical protein
MKHIDIYGFFSICFIKYFDSLQGKLYYISGGVSLGFNERVLHPTFTKGLVITDKNN